MTTPGRSFEAIDLFEEWYTLREKTPKRCYTGSGANHHVRFVHWRPEGTLVFCPHCMIPTVEFRRLGQCFIDWATAVVGEADRELTCVTLTYHSSGPIYRIRWDRRKSTQRATLTKEQETLLRQWCDNNLLGTRKEVHIGLMPRVGLYWKVCGYGPIVHWIILQSVLENLVLFNQSGSC